ncbi:nucleotidyltransferase domain-containing protein [Streptomyces canus]|uniref:nucleotidyltransferase domain-containing protein n=1 Tax=Streptomyces canus TaxID=58343 RepID=UPI003F6B2185
MTRIETPWGPWEPAALADVATLFSSVEVPWWVAGGYAIELAVGYSFRDHSDLDVLSLRRDQGSCSSCCPHGSGGRRTRLGLSGRGNPERSCPPPSTTSGAVPALRVPGGSRSCSMRRRARTGFPGDAPRSGAPSTSWAGARARGDGP